MATPAATSSATTTTRDSLEAAWGLALLWVVPVVGVVLAFLLG